MQMYCLYAARMVLSMLVPSLDLEVYLFKNYYFAIITIFPTFSVNFGLLQRIQLNDRACSESASIDLNNINSSDEAVSIETFVVKYKNVLGYVAANGEAGLILYNSSSSSVIDRHHHYHRQYRQRQRLLWAMVSVFFHSTGTR